MASWFTRAIDRITPWDRGGEVQRRQEERRRREEEEAYRRANAPRPTNYAPNQNQNVQNQRPEPQKPVNLFEDLNKNLVFNKPQTNVPVVNKQDVQPAPRPGEVVKPQQSLLDKVRDQIDANTQADKYRRQEENKVNVVKKPINYKNPVVNFAKRNLAPTGVFNFGKELVQGGLRAPIEFGQQIEQQYRASKEGTRLKNEGYTGADKDELAFRAAPSKTWQPSGWQKRLFGDSKVQSLRDSSEELSTLIEQKFGKKPSPTALTAAMILSYGIPGSILGKNGKRGIKAGVENVDDLVETGAKSLDDIAITKSVEDAIEATRPKPISVQKNIPVDEVAGEPFDVPVQVRTPKKPKGPVIREMPGDAKELASNEDIARYAAINRESDARAVNNVSVPSKRIEGVKPRTPEQPFVLNKEAVARGQDKVIDDYADMIRDMGEGNGTQLIPDGEGGYFRNTNNIRFGDTKGKRMSKGAWRDEAERQLRNGEAEPSVQKAFDESADPEVQALLTKGERPDVPEGTPITIKESKTIGVIDNTDVPQNLPETPGTVRVTETTAPSNAKSEVVATQTPVSLPKEVQNILDNPKKFNKRQVASARNQRKLAKQMAKTQEETADALKRIETVSPAAQSGEGFIPTGEFAKSQNSGPYQKVSRATEMQAAVQETANMSPGDVLQTARKNQLETGGFNRRDIRNVAALFEQKRIPRGTPEWNEAKQILKEDGTVWGQTGALRNYTMRRTASANELISRYESKIYRLADDPSKIDGKMLDEVEAAEDAFTQARDEALIAYNRFTENPTSANANLYHVAQDAAEKADKAAKITEYKVADKVLKGNKDIKQARVLEKMANDADMYQMDAVDASMLSGTGTFLRNFVNSAVGGIEETLFGGGASRISRKLTGQSIGGGVGKGTLKGFGEGSANLVDASKARASNAGKNVLDHLKNWSTTGNQLGDTVIDSQTKHSVIDHYTQLLKEQGYTGRELTDRAGVMARQDPDNLTRAYSGAARVAAGLGAGVTRGNKIETIVKNMISDTISAGNPGRASEGIAKLATRMTIGFPTAIGRSTIEGVKRFTLGAPTFFKAAKTADPQARAILIKEGIKQAGTGALVIPPLFYALGAADIISGAYPSDKDERAQWEREGKTENSIKIGGAWYQLPAYLGAWAVPGLFYASLGRSGGNWSEAATDAAKAVPSLLPTDQASNVIDVINGRSDLGKFMAQTGAGAVRAITPAGALLNQIAKAFDPSKNDTNSGTNMENFIDKVLSGIPGVNNMADIPDKKDAEGNVLTNPSPLEIFAGAASDVQGAGEERSRQINEETNSAVSQIDKYGLLNDPNLEGVLENTGLEALNKAKSGEQLDESEIKALKEGLVKGVSSEGTDTAYLEREQYDTNLAVLKLKRDLMNSDPTVKPSSLKDINVAIKRGQIYKEDKIPYDFITDYKDTSLTEWRAMGDPDSDDYDPDMYEKLWDMDAKMAKAGVSYGRKGLDKQKYYDKNSGRGGGGGRGGSGSRNIDTSFGTLKTPGYAPRVKQYSSIESQAGNVPVIRKVRPNIVHKITSSG